MVIHKKKKVTKYRAHTTHGGGHRKKRRGAGSRGGRGNAGTGKRAGHKKAGQNRKFGKYGFNAHHVKKLSINVSEFSLNKISKLIESGKVTKDGDFYLIDLNKLGFDKVLGSGSVNLKLKFVNGLFTPLAAEKIKAAGGELIEAEQVSSETKETNEETK
jgi:large subunit ribosomal protein L15